MIGLNFNHDLDTDTILNEHELNLFYSLFQDPVEGLNTLGLTGTTNW